MTPNSTPTLLQSISGIAVTITAAGVLWACSTLNVAQERLARIEEQVKVLNQDRYTSTDANKDNQIFGTKLANIEKRLERIEARSN